MAPRDEYGTLTSRIRFTGALLAALVAMATLGGVAVAALDSRYDARYAPIAEVRAVHEDVLIIQCRLGILAACANRAQAGASTLRLKGPPAGEPDAGDETAPAEAPAAADAWEAP